MTIPDSTLDAVAMLYAEAIVATREGDRDAAFAAHCAAGEVIRKAFEAALFPEPWAGQAKVSA